VLELNQRKSELKTLRTGAKAACWRSHAQKEHDEGEHLQMKLAAVAKR
jgi:hypothetical protein